MEKVFSILIPCVMIIVAGCERRSSNEPTTTSVEQKTSARLLSASNATTTNEMNVTAICRQIAAFSGRLSMEKSLLTNSPGSMTAAAVSNAVANCDDTAALSLCTRVVFGRQCRDWEGLMDVLQSMLSRNLAEVQRLMVNRLITFTLSYAGNYLGVINHVDRLVRDRDSTQQGQIIDLLQMKRTSLQALGQYDEAVDVARTMIEIAENTACEVPGGTWLNSAKALIARSEGRPWQHLDLAKARHFQKRKRHFEEQQMTVLPLINAMDENKRETTRRELIRIMQGELSNKRLAPWEQTELSNEWQSLINNIK